ncbi:MAG: hypothetical protein LBQ59_01590 [Candidatus Peribacteria bacterium]|nr:hypothetical protein [Candidatus Peribacteria bacterium]
MVNNSDLTQSSPCKGEVKTISPFYLQNDILPPLQGGTKGGLCLTPVSYFDLYNDYPIIKSSSKRDSFFKKNKNSPIEVIYNNELEELLKNENIKSIY